MKTTPPHNNVIPEDFCPKVSIIIPVYNTGNYLSECLESVINQNYSNLEIICVDDGSTDISPSILNYYKKKDKRIKCFWQENKGQSSARNFALDVITGEYVMFLDSDDLLIHNAVLQCVESVYLRKCISAVIFNMEMFFPDGNHFTCFSGPLYQNRFPLLSSRRTEISINFTNAATGFFNTELINRHHIRFPEGMIYEDWVFMVRLMTSEDFIFFWLNSPLYLYRRGFSKSTTSLIDKRCLDLFRAYEESNTLLTNSINDRKQIFVNDAKILNEGIGFLLENVFKSNNNSIIRAYTGELCDILGTFPTAYFMMLCSYLSEERYYAAIFLRKESDKISNSNELITAITHLKVMLTRKRHTIAIREKILAIINIAKNKMKRILRFIMPTYRVSSNIREKVEISMWEIAQIHEEIREIDKKIGKIESYSENDWF